MKRAALICLMILAVCNSTASALPAQNNSDEVKGSAFFTATIKIRANIYYGDEDETNDPIANNSFYLLDKSAADILRNAKFEFDAEEQPTDDESYLHAAALSFLLGIRDDAEIVSLFITAELRKYQKGRIVTNKFGHHET